MRHSLSIEGKIYYGIQNNKWSRIAFQVLLIIGFSALTAAAKRLHPSLGIPSSSAPFWLSAMIIARSTMKWDGAGIVVGIGTALWGIPLGLEQSFGQNLASFALAGAFLDIIARIPKIDILRWWGAAICALMANMAQFGIIIYFALSATVVKHFMMVGMLESALFHVAFGIAAGLVGWSVFHSAEYGLKKLAGKI